ncbi:MAG: pyridoxal-phosphate dependent enzyme [Deltaproteobacteria bacterium]|nr:pyridoxal-phosphate dependent enzyme [Deltaproteobacteria bacterium]
MSEAPEESSEGVDLPQPLLDQATPNDPPIARDSARRARIAQDLDAELVERLQAFEDVMDSEVGDTALTRARNIERTYGIRQLFLKFEGGNPTGTQKDRIAFAQVRDAMRRGYDAITVATCGNYGAAMGLAASLAGMRCVVYVPGNWHPRRVAEMLSTGVELERIEGDYEEAVRLSTLRAEEDDLYDANPGGSNTALQLQAYGQIAAEIYDELRDAPAIVAVPVSNGTTVAGIYRGFLSLYRRGKTSRIPRIVGGSSYRKNPIVHAFRRGKPTVQDLDPKRIHETRINEPLINWHSIDGDQALESIRSSSGFAADATDRTMIALARRVREKEGLSILPASAAGLAALLAHHERTPLPGDRYVAVLTGRRA